MTNSLPSEFSISIILIGLVLGQSCSSEKDDHVRTSLNVKKENEPTCRILILGDSITEGYGVSQHQAFPALLERKLNHEFPSSPQATYKVINAGISGSTTSGGVSRIEWLLKSNPDYLIIALGGNDGLRGVPVIETKNNLEKIILAAKEKDIPLLLAGMKIPPNYGDNYTRKFSHLFKDLAKEQGVDLLPFLWEGVGGDPSMNLPDRIHPNPAGHQKISNTVFEALVQHLPSKIQ